MIPAQPHSQLITMNYPYQTSLYQCLLHPITLTCLLTGPFLHETRVHIITGVALCKWPRYDKDFQLTNWTSPKAPLPIVLMTVKSSGFMRQEVMKDTAFSSVQGEREGYAHKKHSRAPLPKQRPCDKPDTRGSIMTCFVTPCT